MSQDETIVRTILLVLIPVFMIISLLIYKKIRRKK